jgi:hypothetical protein
MDITRRAGGVTIRPETVNGEPGAVVVDADGELIAVWSIEVAGDRVASIRSVVNPDKLAHLGPVGGTRKLFDRARRRTGDA